MNEFVRARAMLAPSGSGTVVIVRIPRPSYMSVLMASMGVLIIAGLVVQTILVAMTKGLAEGLPASAVFVPLGPVIWAMVMGANFTSARSEARDLVGLIGAALVPDRERLTDQATDAQSGVVRTKEPEKELGRNARHTGTAAVDSASFVSLDGPAELREQCVNSNRN